MNNRQLLDTFRRLRYDISIKTTEGDPMKPETRKKLLTLAGLIAVIAALVWLYSAKLKPLYESMGGAAYLRDWLTAHTWLGRIAFLALSVAQIVIAFIPGEPLELAAGYAFGAAEGTVLCVAGIMLGSALVYALVRTLGMRIINVFFSAEKVRSLPFWQNQKRLELIAFILFLIPGTPKDLMTYAIGLTPVRLHRWLIITGTARLPSVITSTLCADAMAAGDYRMAIGMLLLSALMALIGILYYRRSQRT